jgi:hypothetical protein
VLVADTIVCCGGLLDDISNCGSNLSVEKSSMVQSWCSN